MPQYLSLKVRLVYYLTNGRECHDVWYEYRAQLSLFISLTTPQSHSNWLGWSINPPIFQHLLCLSILLHLVMFMCLCVHVKYENGSRMHALPDKLSHTFS
jgi:hypothetical protein